jgi:spore photoproduct lyase
MSQFQHIGTGQSSDSLVWGNRENVLKDLCEFAARHPKVLLEFKTKSANVKHLLQLDVPKNVVCSWSLNTEAIVENEEHFTASLDKRLEAARKAADAGIHVAFHFHPVVYYEGWEADYEALVGRVQSMFKPEEVLFVSFGSVTFIKPVIQKLRDQGHNSKMLQMEMVPDPHGKLSYPDPIKIEIFSNMYKWFKPWRNKVFQYLCMERAYFWDEVFGWHYPNNDHFAASFAHSVWQKIYSGAGLGEMLKSLPYEAIEHRVD